MGRPSTKEGAKTYYYRPQRSCSKVMFSQASVILFTRGCVCLPDTSQADTHPAADGYCSGRYASYWNAFLFGRVFTENYMKMKEIDPVHMVETHFLLENL